MSQPIIAVQIGRAEGLEYHIVLTGLILVEYDIVSVFVDHLDIAHRLIIDFVDTLDINGEGNIRRDLVVVVRGADFVQHIVARNKVVRHDFGSGCDIIYQHLCLVAAEYLQLRSRKPVTLRVNLLDLRLCIGDIVVGGLARDIHGAAVCGGNRRGVVDLIAVFGVGHGSGHNDRHRLARIKLGDRGDKFISAGVIAILRLNAVGNTCGDIDRYRSIAALIHLGDTVDLEL